MLQFCLSFFTDSKFALLFKSSHDVTRNDFDNHLLPEDLGGNKEMCDWLSAAYESYRNTPGHTLSDLLAEGQPACTTGAIFHTVICQRNVSLGSMPFHVLRPSDLILTKYTLSQGSLFLLLWKWMKAEQVECLHTDKTDRLPLQSDFNAIFIFKQMNGFNCLKFGPWWNVMKARFINTHVVGQLWLYWPFHRGWYVHILCVCEWVSEIKAIQGIFKRGFIFLLTKNSLNHQV